ncbi:MAG: LLM class flavin-dependent oxidoreductase [Gordonia sp. (in: high G+C Gram-positive bacteria)]
MSTINLNLFLMPGGQHEAAWRHPLTDPREPLGIDYFSRLARKGEEYLFDSLFLADTLWVGPGVGGRPIKMFEPYTLLAALAAATEHIGLIATASTTFSNPYFLARQFASLDSISGGRAGWNIVTSHSPEEARNTNAQALPSHGERYAKADEFLDVVLKLWQSWDADAIRIDPAAHVYADAAKIHSIDHDGKHFRVAGPLDVGRSPQVTPLLVQAGSSEDGRQLAARYAEAVFTAQQTKVGAQEFYADLKGRLAGFGRDEHELKILPGLMPYVGDTEEQAYELQRSLNDLMTLSYSLDALHMFTGTRFRAEQLDEPFPDLGPNANADGIASRALLIQEMARADGLTIRQVAHRLGGARGHLTVAGTAEQIADIIIDWVDSRAADGFNIMPPLLPHSLDDFGTKVIPILQERGRFRTSYENGTLRDRYRG